MLANYEERGRQRLKARTINFPGESVHSAWRARVTFHWQDCNGERQAWWTNEILEYSGEKGWSRMRTAEGRYIVVSSVICVRDELGYTVLGRFMFPPSVRFSQKKWGCTCYDTCTRESFGHEEGQTSKWILASIQKRLSCMQFYLEHFDLEGLYVWTQTTAFFCSPHRL